jgi:hypothetical protein
MGLFLKEIDCAISGQAKFGEVRVEKNKHDFGAVESVSGT